METSGRHTFRLQSDLQELARLSTILAEWGAREGLSASLVGVFELCLNEVITNIINYGYGGAGTDGLIALELEVVNGWAEAVTVDQAPAFDPLAQAATPDTSLDVDDRPIGGLGIFFVKELMDDVSYAYENGCNRLTMRKQVA